MVFVAFYEVRMSLLRKGNISGELWLPCLPICIFYYFAQRWQNDSYVSIVLSLAFCTLPRVVYSGLEGSLVPWSQSLGYKGIIHWPGHATLETLAKVWTHPGKRGQS